MITALISLILSLPTVLCYWTWIGGSIDPGDSGYFTAKGVANAQNTPPSMTSPSMFSTSDKVYIGLGWTGFIRQDNIYSYSFASKEWIWELGDGQTFTYPTFTNFSVPSVNFTFGGREGAAAFIDETTQTIFVFGGLIGNAEFTNITNSLFTFNLNTQEVTWIGGDPIKGIGNFGQFGVESSNVWPVSRMESAYFYDATNGMFYVFGGMYGDWVFANNLQSTHLNDLMRFNVSSMQWAWVQGTKGYDQPGVYGQQFVQDPANTPGARRSSAYFYDNVNRKFYLFGGMGFSQSTFGNLNDLWQYDIDSNQFTWLGGKTTVNDNGVYGSKWVPSYSILPSSRGGSYMWVDIASSYIYLYGGLQLTWDGNNAVTISYAFNDLWRYNLITTQWMWIGGSETPDPPVYGTMGVADPSNNPPGLYFGAGFFDQNTKVFTMVGGGLQAGATTSNELWSYKDVGPYIPPTTTKRLHNSTSITITSTTTPLEIRRKLPVTQQDNSTGGIPIQVVIIIIVIGVFLILILMVVIIQRNYAETNRKRRAMIMQMQQQARATGSYPEGDTYEQNVAPAKTGSLSDAYHAAPEPRRQPALHGTQMQQPPPMMEQAPLSSTDDEYANPADFAARLAAQQKQETHVQPQPEQPLQVQQKPAGIMKPDLPDFLECSRNDFTIQQQIGSQNGNILHLALAAGDPLRSYGDYVLLKVYGDDFSSLQHGFERLFWQEVSLLWRFNEHKNIGKMLAYCKEPVSIVFQNYPGTLENVLVQRNIPFTKARVLEYALGTARAIEAIHSNGYAHRYIKPRNIYINQDGANFYAIIAGLGGCIKADNEELAKKSFPVYRPDSSSISFIAPEQFLALRGQLPDENVGAHMKAGDIFSWSTILCKMIKTDNLKEN